MMINMHFTEARWCAWWYPFLLIIIIYHHRSTSSNYTLFAVKWYLKKKKKTKKLWISYEKVVSLIKYDDGWVVRIRIKRRNQIDPYTNSNIPTLFISNFFYPNCVTSYFRQCRSMSIDDTNNERNKKKKRFRKKIDLSDVRMFHTVNLKWIKWKKKKFCVIRYV